MDANLPTEILKDSASKGLPTSLESCLLKRECPSEEECEEACPICGDKVSGYHYGLLTCESCKGFFKRTVQNNKHYTCMENQTCPIDKMQRKRCPYCRFQKCLSVGMKLEAVRADRMRGGRNKFGPLYRRDRELKQQKRTFVVSGSGIKHDSALQTIHTFQSNGIMPPSNEHKAHLLEHSQLSPFKDYSKNIPGCTPTDMSLTTQHSIPGYQIYNSYPFCPVKSEYMEPLYMSSPDHHLMGSHYVPVSPCGMPPLILELLRCEMEEYQLQARILNHLQQEQANRGKHDRLNTFGIMTKMADQTLFCLVEWARSCVFFKELKVEDQMRLLQNCWSELLVMDHIYRQVFYGKEGSILLITGQQIDLSTISSQAGDALNNLVSRTQELVSKLRALQMDRQEFVCLKFLVLFSSDVKNLENQAFVESVQEQVNRALMDYTACNPQQADKFGQLLLRLPEIRAISMQIDEYLFMKHLSGDLPCNNLLIEMLHAKQS